MENREVAYICMQDMACCDDENCARNGGDCMHTTRVDRAANFELAEDGSGFWMEKGRK